MPTFEYQGVNRSGERVSGLVAGISMEQALSSLSQTGLVVERINQASAESAVVQPPPVLAPPPNLYDTIQSPTYREQAAYQERSAYGQTVEPPPTGPRSYVATSVAGPLVGTVPLANLAFFYRQFGTMLEAGVPIVQSLDTLAKQSHNLKLHQVVTEIRGHVEAGREISAGMQRYPEVFPPLSVSLVRAGEEGGFVAQSFKQLADYTDREISLRNLIRKLTLHPKIVLVTAFVLVGGVTLFVNSLGKTNILPVGFVMFVSAILAGLLVFGFLFARVGLANPRVKYNWDMLLVKLPLGIGGVLHGFAMAKFGTAMAFLHKGGVPVQNSIKLAADACGNEYVRAQVIPASRHLETGAGIADTLRGTNAFSPIVMDMVDTGERTGNLDSMLLRMSTFYEDDSETRARQVAQIVSVILLLLVAVYVCVILVMAYTKLIGTEMSGGGD